MKTLYESLKPEVLAKLEKQAEECPIVTTNIIKSLKVKYSWVDLTIWEGTELCMYNNLFFSITNLKNLFKES